MNGTPTRSVMARSAAAWRSACSRLSITHGPPMKTNGAPAAEAQRPDASLRWTAASRMRLYRDTALSSGVCAGFRLVLQRRPG